ncbi:MAG: bifunctional folylpolyglutamate synthase/dihydrofolate synthase [Candidatus Methylacidiphilales bacterium]
MMSVPSTAGLMDWLHGLRHSGVKLGLDNMRALCAALDHPENSFPCIHVAGTNGKGSVCAMLESVLRQAGIRTGCYTSPHLVRYPERFRIDGRPVDDALLLKELEAIRIQCDVLSSEKKDATFFEVTTALAFRLFEKAGVELAIFETGLGGRLDSTNVVDPLVSVITSVSYDHQEYLGHTLEKIAWEKAGIIKPGRPWVLGPLEERLRDVVRDQARAVGSGRMVQAEPMAWLIEKPREEGAGSPVSGTATRRAMWRDETWELGLRAQCQAVNAGITLSVCDVLGESGWRVDESARREGLRAVVWPARFQTLSDSPEIILDGAHNGESVRDLVLTWNQLFDRPPEVIGFGCLRDKLSPDLIAPMEGWFRSGTRVVTVPVKDKRSADCSELNGMMSSFGAEVVESAGNAPEMWRRIHAMAAGGRGLVCGSLYLAGELLGWLQQERSEWELNG